MSLFHILFLLSSDIFNVKSFLAVPFSLFYFKPSIVIMVVQNRWKKPSRNHHLGLSLQMLYIKYYNYQGIVSRLFKSKHQVG